MHGALALMPRRDSPRARILRLFRTFTALDSHLTARMLGISPNHASALLCHLARDGRVLRATRRSDRRPRVRVEYHREIR